MKAIRISIDLEKNDPVDYKAGGPMYLGFDFYVDPNVNLTKIKEKIMKALKSRGLECLCVTTEEPRDFDAKLWTIEDIEREIQNYKQHGFTLIELVVLLVVLAILGTIVFKMIHRFLM